VSLTTTASYDLVTCSKCGKNVHKRNACGVKVGDNACVWRCVDCISSFTPWGMLIHRIKQTSGEES